MKIIISIVISMALLSMPVSAKTDWQKDLTIYKTTLEKMHPSLNSYISKAQFEVEFNKIYNKEISTLLKAFIELSKLNARIEDGHTNIILPDDFYAFIAENDTVIPLKIKIKDNSIYAIINEKIDTWNEVVSINGNKSNRILTQMQEIIAADAGNIYFKNNDIEKYFALYYFLLYGESDDFIVQYVDAKNSEIHIKKYSPKKGKDVFDDEALEYTGKKINHDTFVLDIGTFYFEDEQQDFENFLQQTFKTLKTDSSIKNLVIDVRNNAGGLRQNSILLYSYLTDKNFKQRIKTQIVSNKITKNNLVNLDNQAIDEIQQHLKGVYSKNLSSEQDNLQYLMQPNENNWNKNTTVLINGGTFSAGCEFALLAKNNPKIKLLGQPCGLNYYQHSGDINLVYELPNSGLLLSFSMVKIFHFVADKSVNKNDTVVPDILEK